MRKKNVEKISVKKYVNLLIDFLQNYFLLWLKKPNPGKHPGLPAILKKTKPEESPRNPCDFKKYLTRGTIMVDSDLLSNVTH